MSRIYVVDPWDVDSRGALGIHLVVRALRAAGHVAQRAWMGPRGMRIAVGETWIVPAGGQPAPDAWFVSILHVRQMLALPRLFRAIGLELRSDKRGHTDPLVAFGGSAMSAPAPIEDFADVVALGDGELNATAIASELHRGKTEALIALRGRCGLMQPGREARLQRAEMPAIEASAVVGAGRKGAIVEIARGCRHRCAYCAIGWSGGTYREAATPDVCAALRSLRGRTVNLFSPSWSSHSGCEEIGAESKRLGIRVDNTDSRASEAHRIQRPLRSLAFGVEGLSERLRRALRKPLTDSALLEMLRGLDAEGVARIKLYMIPGLPLETDTDGAEFLALLPEMRHAFNGNMAFTSTHFRGFPGTPMQFAGNSYSDSAAARHRAIEMELRAQHARGLPLWVAYAFSGREMHECEMSIIRSGREASLLIQALKGSLAASASPRWRKAASSVGLDIDRALAPSNETTPQPWDHVEQAPREVLWRAWEAYRRTVAIAPPIRALDRIRRLS